MSHTVRAPVLPKQMAAGGGIFCEEGLGLAVYKKKDVRLSKKPRSVP